MQLEQHFHFHVSHSEPLQETFKTLSSLLKGTEERAVEGGNLLLIQFPATESEPEKDQTRGPAVEKLPFFWPSVAAA